MIYALLENRDETSIIEQKHLFEQYFDLNPSGNEKIIWVNSLTQWQKVGQKNDTLIAVDLYSFGNHPSEILLALSQVLSRKKRVIIIKQQLDFRHDQENLLMAKALKLSAQLTEDILTNTPPRQKSRVGRPVGSKSVNKKLAAHHDDIENALRLGVKITTLAKRYQVTRNTVRKYIQENIPEELQSKNKKPK